ncbi:hypothetical protein VNI00_007644 [Paramarasmius palmivorus]|uniref:C2H2-type domain-containing protein n=1 Tax=Paramarasmius palmivorus TaxID=297713 RepID=A0AAW0D3Q9_9AGAR
MAQLALPSASSTDYSYHDEIYEDPFSGFFEDDTNFSYLFGHGLNDVENSLGIGFTGAIAGMARDEETRLEIESDRQPADNETETSQSIIQTSTRVVSSQRDGEDSTPTDDATRPSLAVTLEGNTVTSHTTPISSPLDASFPPDKGKGKAQPDVPKPVCEKMGRTKSGSLSIYLKDAPPAAPPTNNVDELKENETLSGVYHAHDVQPNVGRKRKLSATGDEPTCHDTSVHPDITTTSAFEGHDDASLFPDNSELALSTSFDPAPLHHPVRSLPSRAQFAQCNQGHDGALPAVCPTPIVEYRSSVGLVCQWGEIPAQGNNVSSPHLAALLDVEQGFDDDNYGCNQAPLQHNDWQNAENPGNVYPDTSTFHWSGGLLPQPDPAFALDSPAAEYSGAAQQYAMQDDHFQPAGDHPHPATNAQNEQSPASSSEPSFRRQRIPVYTDPVLCLYPTRNGTRCTHMIPFPDGGINTAADHIRNAHHVRRDGTGKLCCDWPQCGKTFGTWPDFARHLNNGKHTKFDVVRCEFCDGTAARWDALEARHKNCYPGMPKKKQKVAA